MADVFISYDRVAHDAAALIAVKLRQLKIDVWFDVRARPEEAQRAKVVLVCWSRAAVTSELVRDEAAIGQRSGKLIGCFLEQVALSPPFSPPQTENLTNWNGQDEHPGWERLLQRIGERIGRMDLAGAGGAAGRAGGRIAAPPPFVERRPERPEPRAEPPPRSEPPPRAESSRSAPDQPQDPKRAKRGADPWGDTWTRRPAHPPPTGPGSEPPPSAGGRDPGEGEISGPGGLKISFGIDQPARGSDRGREAGRDRRGRETRDDRGRDEAPRESGSARAEAPKRDEFSFSSPGQSSSKSMDWFTGPGDSGDDESPREFEISDDPPDGDFFASAAAGYRDKERPRRSPKRRRSHSGGGARVAGILAGLAIVGACVFGAAYFATTYFTQSNAAPELDFADSGQSGEVTPPPAEPVAPQILPTAPNAAKAGAAKAGAAKAGAAKASVAANAATPSVATTTTAAPVRLAPPDAQGALVDQLKRELRRLGLAADGGDGVLGRRATASVRALQTAIGVRATGRASQGLLQRASTLRSCQMQRGVRDMSFRRPVSGAAEAGSRAECCAAANLDARTNAASSGLGYVRNWPSACGNLGTTASAKLGGTIQGQARDNGTYTECQASAADPTGAPGLYRCTVTGQVACLYQAQARERLACE